MNLILHFPPFLAFQSRCVLRHQAEDYVPYFAVSFLLLRHLCTKIDPVTLLESYRALRHIISTMKQLSLYNTSLALKKLRMRTV